MADIIDFNTKIKTKSEPVQNPFSIGLLEELNRNADEFQELVVFFKKNNGYVGIVDTNCSIEDRALFVQMLQHQIICSLDRTHTSIMPEESLFPENDQ